MFVGSGVGGMAIIPPFGHYLAITIEVNSGISTTELGTINSLHLLIAIISVVNCILLFVVK